MVFSLLFTNPLGKIRRRLQVNRSHALTQPFFVLITLVDIKSLYGIQSPDIVALNGFSGIIRPLSAMFYAAKDMAVKVIVL